MVLLGQEGIAFLMRSTCPLAAHTSSEEADYGLATYVMLSRPTKLEDLWIVDLPPRNVFEKFLHEHNPLLVQRMQEFEGQACVDERKALKYVQDFHGSASLGCHSICLQMKCLLIFLLSIAGGELRQLPCSVV